jgi:SPP1 family predicted phage head-tail adaptor
MLKAGLLDRQITIQTRTSEANNYGENVDTWSSDVTVWASVKYQALKEIFQADQLSALQTVAFTIRYKTGISAAKCRVLYEGLIYNIRTVNEIGRREGLLLIGEAENDGE